ncbi:MAG TPA: hypothetical protein VFX70_05950 [Mycobacteriales bacterium]|nr:hypothetical protein [Mycobacteriales bacterium]
MIRKLHDIGMSSDAAYLAGFSSIGIAVAAWISSKTVERAGTARADHWGMFVGLWAPTFISLGNALRMEEEHEAIRLASRTRTGPAAEPVGSTAR